MIGVMSIRRNRSRDVQSTKAIILALAAEKASLDATAAHVARAAPTLER